MHPQWCRAAVDRRVCNDTSKRDRSKAWALFSCETVGEAPAGFRRVVIDSREARRGDLFVALPGEHKDGHDFVADALERGAARPARAAARRRRCRTAPSPTSSKTALTALQRIAAGHRAALPVKVIGVTGSVGKTTTKEIAAFILGQRYRRAQERGEL